MRTSKIFSETNNLGNASGNIIFVSCFNGRPMLRKLTSLNFEWGQLISMMTSLLAITKINPFEFSEPAEAHSGLS